MSVASLQIAARCVVALAHQSPLLNTIEEAGGRGQWLLHNTLVRDGSVLMSIGVVDIRRGDVPPQFTIDDVSSISPTVADRLGG